jgi:TrpR-related protein YerC/YecD
MLIQSNKEVALRDRNKREVDFFEAILFLSKASECERFFKDLCTPQELSALKERWRVCQMLDDETLSYRDIQKMTGVSLTTIGRVARFLREEAYGGYRLMLNLIHGDK